MFAKRSSQICKRTAIKRNVMDQVAEIASRFALATKRYGIAPNDVFADMDRGRTGYLTPVAFDRAMSSFNFAYTNSDSAIMRSAYLEDGRINYRRFLRDAANPQLMLPSQKPEDNTKLLKEFGTKLQSDGMDFYDSVLPYDRIRVGHVSCDTIFKIFGFSRLVQDITTQYSDRITGEVNYVSLAKDIENVMRQHSGSTLAEPLPPFFENFVRCLVSRNINVYDSFVGCDRLKKGYVPMQTFLAVISGYGVGLSPGQLQDIAYPFVNDYGHVDYLFFARKVEEQKNKFETKFESEGVEPSDVEDVLSEIRSRLEIRRIRLRDQLETAERENGGRLPRAKFYKLLSFIGFTFSSSDVLALDERFMFSDGSMNVQDFVTRVDPPEVVEQKIDADDVIYRLRTHLRNRKLSIDKYFSMFDREGSGSISIAQLLSAMNRVEFHPTSAEVNAVAQKFGNGRYVFWGEISDLVEPKLPTPVCVTLKTEMDWARKPDGEVIDFFQRLFPVLKCNGIDIRDDFKRVDIRHCGLINSKKFRGILEELPIRITGSEITITIRYYTKPGTDMVCYGDFCDDLIKYGPKPEFELPRPRMPAPEDAEAEKKRDDALRKVKAAMQCRRLAPDEMFVHHDVQKLGSIPVDVFTAAMAPITSLVGNDIVQTVGNSFRDCRQPERVNYRRLCAALTSIAASREDVEEVFETQRQMAGENDELFSILHAIHNKVSDRRKKIYDLFRTVQDEIITSSEFKKILEQFGLAISDGEWQKLIRKYRVNRNNDIDWYVFCKDVDGTV